MTGTGTPTDAHSYEEYEAVVYDVDGTLVDLDVDWNAVAADVLEVYADAGVEPPSRNLWDLLEAADDFGLAAAVEAVIASHEREGARTADRLPHADDLLGLAGTVPVGACSLNCEAACRIALEEHGLTSAVGVVVGRDTVDAWKPDPEPLLEAVRGLAAEPERTLFVGDSPRDEETARRAGTAFEYVGDGLSGV
ncbi:HAD family hydrolase [Natrialbaceae archaeon GCM10025810]|uniref:HAD family hydrolase n=1 Tax=Halovalidus salilacus TaxID=3075124 RepID=UPI0036236C1F